MAENPHYRELLQLLNEFEVEYLIVGGFAVMKYGEPRYTPAPRLSPECPARKPTIFRHGGSHRMTGPNGHAPDNGAPTSTLPAVGSGVTALPQISPEKVKELVAALEVPFDASQIE